MTARPTGFLPWVLPAILGIAALGVLLSGRDFSPMLVELQGPAAPSHPAIIWGQRVVSLLLLAASAERVITHVALRQHLPSALLAGAFLVFWLATVAAPAFLGAHPQLSHEYLYPLIIGSAALLATGQERDRVIDGVRNALFLFLLAGVILVPLNPSMALDASYQRGLVPGVPRLAGLAPHAVALGLFTQTFLLCLWCRPFSSRWLNRLAWLVGLGVLFFAQSKTAWIAFVICSAVLLAVRNGPGVWRRLGDPRQGVFGIVFCLGVIAFVAVLMGVLLLGDVEARTGDFLDTPEGAQLVSMTGRDKIWAVAMEEWRENPLFGYGPGLWDDAYRASIAMPSATHGHNQFMDTLARSGSVGAAALVLYAVVLLVLSVRYAKATGGLSLALFVALALRSVSEVPLLLLGYGTELITHLLLIITLASCAVSRQQVAPASSRTTHRVTS
jgi:O-antigen ligase